MLSHRILHSSFSNTLFGILLLLASTLALAEFDSSSAKDKLDRLQVQLNAPDVTANEL